MKLCALLIVAAVCAVLLPSDVDAGVASPRLRALARRAPLETLHPQTRACKLCLLHFRTPAGVDAGVASPGLRALARRAPLEIAKRQFAKRDDDDSDDGNSTITDFLESDLAATILRLYGVTMQDLDELIEADDEIEPEDRDAIKALTILALAGIEVDSSEESSMMD